jgi:hypothetical protein
MFAFNPTVQDRSGELIAQGMNNAATMQLQGMQSLGESLSGLGKNIADSYSKARETALVKEGNMGTGAALSEVFKTYGTPEQYENFMAGWEKNASNANREAGYLAGQQTVGSALLSMARQNAQIDGYKDLADYKSSVGPGTDTTAAPPKLDSNFARQFYQGLRANNRTHEQALADMDNAGLNWGKQYIEGQKSPFFQ